MYREVESLSFSGVKVAFILQHLGLADMGAPRNDRWGALPPSHTEERHNESLLPPQRLSV